MSESTISTTTTTAAFVYHHHDHHHQQQQPAFHDADAADDAGDDEPFYELIKQPTHMVVIYTLAYAAVFLLAVVGNVLVISVVFSNSSMHTVTNYFIVNLAVADLLVGLLCLPISLVANLLSGNNTYLARALHADLFTR